MHDSYMWLKALHIIAVISWMAGMLYLPRLYVYHAQVAPGSESDVMLQRMEYRLLRYIMLPAMLAVWGLGLWLAIKINAFNPQNGLWMHYKLLLVLAMSALHGMLAKYRKAFAQGKNRHSEKFFRIFNEIPTVLMILIVLIVVLKPV